MNKATRDYLRRREIESASGFYGVRPTWKPWVLRCDVDHRQAGHVHIPEGQFILEDNELHVWYVVRRIEDHCGMELYNRRRRCVTHALGMRHASNEAAQRFHEVAMQAMGLSDGYARDCSPTVYGEWTFIGPMAHRNFYTVRDVIDFFNFEHGWTDENLQRGATA